MKQSRSDSNSIDLLDEEYISEPIRKNTERLIARVEKLADQTERLDDPAVFDLALSHYNPVE